MSGRRRDIQRRCNTLPLKPHDLRHGVAMEVDEQHHDLEQVRGLLSHRRIDTAQVYEEILSS